MHDVVEKSIGVRGRHRKKRSMEIRKNKISE